jgi:hypothetical protein
MDDGYRGTDHPFEREGLGHRVIGCSSRKSRRSAANLGIASIKDDEGNHQLFRVSGITADHKQSGIIPHSLAIDRGSPKG